MSAQTAQEPSMEDILASIRKIISEDGNDQSSDDVQPAIIEPAAPSLPVASPANRHSASAAQSRPVENPAQAMQNADAPSPDSRNSTPPLQTPNAVERREDFSVEEEPSAIDTGSNQSSMPESATGNAPKILAEPAQKASIPGFVEPKPTSEQPNITNVFGENRPTNRPDSANDVETPLHPAIKNAQDFVNHENASLEKVEKPVFQNSDSIAISNSGAPMVSPDSVERREDDERRNHPLRRGADRQRDDFKNALMSPQTDDSVGNAFEELKDAALDNLDGKVATLLRPMLREWLDNNLPSMVERLVRDEIERVSRGE